MSIRSQRCPAPGLFLAALLPLIIATPATGAELAFTAPDGSALATAIGEQFVRPMLSLDPDTALDDRFAWLAHDVTGDDYDELFVELLGAGLCGADGGCPIVGFMREPSGAWSPILTAVGAAVAADPQAPGDLLIGTDRDRQRWRYDPAIRAMHPHSDQ